MIGKIPDRVEQGRGFDGLVKYISQLHKASHIFTSGITSTAKAAAEMKAVSDMNSDAREPFYHLILSWHRTEKPTNEQVEEAVRMQLKALGLHENQYIGAIHTDTDNVHCHIVANRVRPDTFHVVNTRGDFFTIDKTNREIEIAQGWSHDRGPYCVEYHHGKPIVYEQKDRKLLQQLTDGATTIERYTGEVSFERYVRDSTVLSEHCTKAATWQDLHNRFRMHGLTIIRDDKGLVIHGTDKDKEYARASLVKDYSFKELAEKLGQFTEDTRETEHEVQTILTELTRSRAAFTERALDAYMISFVDEKRRNVVKRAVIEHPDCVHLNRTKVGGSREGGCPQFTTRAVLDEESDAMETAARIASSPALRRPSDAAIRNAIDTRKMFVGQLDAFNRTIDGGGICVIRGPAGTGKSYLMSALRDAYQDSRFDVIGLSPTNEVKEAEIKDGFRQAETVDKIISEQGRQQLNKNTVLIVDESGMISNDRMLKLLQAAEERGVAKIIFVGDAAQLPSVERGGLYADFQYKYAAGALTKITRQKEDKQNQAATHFANSRFEDGMAIFHQEDRIKWSDTDDLSRDRLLEAWKADYEKEPASSRFVISYENKDVDFFNRAIHDHLASTGKLGAARTIDTRHGTFEFSVGEAIQFTKNDKRKGITNGLRGKIAAWTKDGMIVDAGDGKRIIVPADFTDFRHGHAGTVYKSQGASISSVFLHHTTAWKDAAGYVALTRQINSALVFASKEASTDWRDIARQMSSSMLKESATAIGQSEPHQFRDVEYYMNQDAIKVIANIKEAQKEAREKAEREKQGGGDTRHPCGSGSTGS